MIGSLEADAEALIRTASAVYADDPAVLESLDELDDRLREPLRLAIAGMVKAGKSTLLNALLGERIAPTDAGECTRLITWYRYCATPTVTLHPHAGEPRRMPVRREEGRLLMDLGGVPAEDIDWIEVGWPLEVLKSMILIDTPGIASLSADTSARATRFLTPESDTPSADAVVYLMRHLHASDVRFLESFRDTAVGSARTVCAVGVLSRSDEIGAGRIDALLSAAKVARRYETDGELAALVLGIIPVAGLVAEGARTLREDEYDTFRRLARLDRADREALLLSADRFVAQTDATTVSTAERAALLARFGIFGVRLATALIRGGVGDSSELADAMVQQSGLVELRQFVTTQFRSRSVALKVRGVLLALEKLLGDHPRDGVEDIRAGLERLTTTAHELRELDTLATLRADDFSLAEADAADARRILGGDGTTATARLGLTEQARDDEVRVSLDAALARWRTLVESPLTQRGAIGVGQVVLRSLDAIATSGAVPSPAADTPAAAPPTPRSEVVAADDSLVSAADVDAPRGPGDAAGEDAAQQRQEDEPRLGGKKKKKRLASVAKRHPLG
ncbi:50S ribosome-binding GTPase [Microbacterium awajiense]|uniref:50S ribosome-binding GTPase n=1 Tax=Microbacterium awajiense TaxID=415214 RepID=A0ABP7AIU9_9MICO